MTPNSRCELISWEQVYQLSRTLALTLHAAAFEPELIVAISRGGCVPARILCDYLDVFDLDGVPQATDHTAGLWQRLRQVVICRMLVQRDCQSGV